MRLEFALSASLLAPVGCSTGPDDFGRCSGSLTITVVQTTVPEFSWTPSGCLVYEVDVSEDRTIDWLLTSIETANTISSPVRYGEAPRRGTTSSGEATRLFAGFSYTVRLTRIGEMGQLVAAEQRFLWQEGP